MSKEKEVHTHLWLLGFSFLHKSVAGSPIDRQINGFRSLPLILKLSEASEDMGRTMGKQDTSGAVFLNGCKRRPYILTSQAHFKADTAILFEVSPVFIFRLGSGWCGNSTWEDQQKPRWRFPSEPESQVARWILSFSTTRSSRAGAWGAATLLIAAAGGRSRSWPVLSPTSSSTWPPTAPRACSATSTSAGSIHRASSPTSARKATGVSGARH